MVEALETGDASVDDASSLVVAVTEWDRLGSESRHRYAGVVPSFRRWPGLAVRGRPATLAGEVWAARQRCLLRHRSRSQAAGHRYRLALSEAGFESSAAPLVSDSGSLASP